MVSMIGAHSIALTSDHPIDGRKTTGDDAGNPR
jgi:hypothetical protein